MKRDPDLIRKILEIAESNIEYSPYNQILKIEGYDTSTIGFHLSLLVEAGYLKASIAQATDGSYKCAYPERLTWDGYEFLDLARNNAVWEKSKKVLKEKSISVSISILSELLKYIVKESLGLDHVPKPPV